MNFVKSEMDNILCRGCLCIDRILMPLNKNIDLFFIFLGNELSISEDSKYYNILLCWECIALLKKAEVFRKRVQTAHRYFERQLSTPIQALTTLNTYRKDDYDQILTENPEEPKVKPERLIFEDSLHEEDGAAADCHIKEENYENDNDHFDYEQEEPKPEMPSLVKTEETKKKYKYRPLGRRVKTKSIKYTDEEMDKCIERVDYTLKEILAMERVKNKPNRIKNMEHRCNVHIMKMADMQKRDLKQKVKESGVKCHECSAVLADREALGAHWAAHVVALLRCQFCGLLGKSRKYVAYHVETRHSIIYSCVLCNVDFRALPEYHRHDRSLHKTLICDYCGKKFNQRSGIERHIRLCHLPIQCEICKKVYKRESILDNHMARCHPEVAWKPVERELTYCVECDKYLPTADLYRIHLSTAKAHRRPGYRPKTPPPESPLCHLPIQCEICKKLYKRMASLDNHMARCHPKVAWKPVKRELTYCVECDKYFATRDLYRNHLNGAVAHGYRAKYRPPESPRYHLPIQCEICKMVYKRERYLDNHMARFHPEVKWKPVERELTYCVECDKYFPNVNLYKTHLGRDEPHRPHRPRRREIPFSHFPIQCEICKKMYKKEFSLDNHMARCHPEVAWKPVERELMYCVECDKYFATRKLYRHHLKTAVAHRPPESPRYHLPIQCEICKMVYKRESTLDNHMARCHPEVKWKPVKRELTYCVECDMHFPTEDLFKRHLRVYVRHQIKPPIKLQFHHLPAVCYICKFEFKRKNYLAEHMLLMHRIEKKTKKPIVEELAYCVECNLQFPSEYFYKRHLTYAVAHKRRIRQKVPCPDCGKIFSRKNYMDNHYKLVHVRKSQHFCELCGKHFINGYAIRTHKKFVHEKHEKPKNKICDICGRGFHTNRVLTNHKRTHTGERPHKCSYCPAAFAQNVARKTHEKTQHKHLLLDPPIKPFV